MKRLCCGLAVIAMLANRAVVGAPAPPITYYVQLVWGTDQPAPEHAPFRAIDPKLKHELASRFRWASYWEISSRVATVARGGIQKVALSQDCRIEIESRPPTTREVRLYRNGKLVRTSRADVRSNGLSIHGGDATADGVWFVVIRRDKPQYP